MSRLFVGLALAVGLAASTALGQVDRKAASDPTTRPEADSGRVQYIEPIVRRFDTNGDGVITPDEVAKLDDRMKAQFEGIMRRVGRDPKQPIKVTELRDAMVQDMGPRRAKAPARASSSGFRGRPPVDSSSDFGGGPTGRPSPDFRGGPPSGSSPDFRGGLGAAPSSIPSRPGGSSPRRPSESPDPKAAMVAIQAVLVELVREEPGTGGKRQPGSPAAEAKPDSADQGKSVLGLIDLDLTASDGAILTGLRKVGVPGQIEVLNRIQVTTLDKQPASVHFGRQEALISATTRSTFGASNSVTITPVGLMMEIEPRVAPGDTIVLQIDVNESRLGRSEEGAALFTSTGGETIRRPPTITTVIKSVVKAPAGKTVVVSRKSEYGVRQTETLLLVSARVLSPKAD